MGKETALDNSIEHLAKKIIDEIAAANVSCWSSFEREANIARKEAISNRWTRAANCAWFLATVCNSRGLMASAYADINDLNYRCAWVKLEQVEIACADLNRNAFLDLEDFKVVELGNLVKSWQGLFPYRFFASPEMIIKEERCTICNQIRNPFSSCDHQIGRVYDGTICGAVVLDLEFRGLALVTDPVQKFSVLIPEPDPFDYSPVRFVAERVTGAFAYWTTSEQLAYHDHELFKSWPPNDVCPCGSGRIYKDCCLDLPGVIMPHISISFDEAPPKDLTNFMVRRHLPNENKKN